MKELCVSDLKTIKHLLAGILFLLLFGAVFFTRELVLPVLLGFIIAMTFSPLCRALVRAGLNQVIAATLIVVSLGSLLTLTLVIVAAPISEWLSDLPGLESKIRNKVASLSSSVETVRDVARQVEDIAEDAGAGGEDVQRVTVEQPQLLTTAASGAVTILTTMMIALVLALFFLSSNALIIDKMSRLSRTTEQRDMAIQALQDVERGISRYLLSITVINAGLGLCVALAMWALGLSMPWIWGVVAFLLNFIPVLGAMAGSVAIFAIAIIQFDTIAYAALAPVIYMTLSSFEGQFVTPALVGKRMEINAVSVILTVVVWGWLWGIPGVVIAVPFLVIVKSVADNVPGWKTVSLILSPIREDQPAK